MMIFNYIKLAFRSLLRDTTYSIINIGGLTIGIAGSILLMMWVEDELSYDRFHEKYEHIYKLNSNFSNNGNAITWTNTPGPIAAFARNEVTAVQEAVRISADYGTKLLRYNEKEFAETNNAAYIDENFFKVFDFHLLQGNPENPFPDTKSVIIDETTAKKYFGNEEAQGKILRVENKEDFIVRGVMEDMPANSSIKFSILFPFQILIDNYKPNDYWKSLESDWGDYNYHTYLLLRPSASPDDVASQLTDIHHKNQNEAGVQYSLQPLSKLHLYAADMTAAGIQTVRIFMIVAIALLLIAAINYINLATARASKRAKEVGVRKTVGADRGKLIGQFLTESGIITITALLLAIAFIQLIIPFYNALSGKALNFHLFDPSTITLIAIVLFMTWMVAGTYPALVLSSFQPVRVIRGKLTLSGSNSTFRKILVVTQFTLSIAIIIATLVISRQLDFIQNMKLGYNKDNIFSFALRGDMFKNKETIRNELSKQPGVTGLATANQNILNIGTTTGDTDWKGKPEDQHMMIHPMNIDENFMNLLGMELIEGRNFTGSNADTMSLILNETAVKEAGIKDPIGKSFTLWDTKATIIGVVKDFHHQSVHNAIEPTAFFYRPEWQWLVYVKTDGIHNKEVVTTCEKIWKQYNPSYPFDYNFMDLAYDKMYKSEQRMSQLFTIFSFVTIAISCLGLFGLTTFTIAQRVKEIGIRKVMGASVNQIIIILSKDFLALVGIALVIAIPVAYFFSDRWLDNFAYRVQLSPEISLMAGGLALGIAFITMSFQTIRAAFLNPANSLRNE